MDEIRFPPIIQNPGGKFYMSVDIARGLKDESSYVLIREVDGAYEVILHKKILAKAVLKREVKNLSEYFNAPIMGGK